MTVNGNGNAKLGTRSTVASGPLTGQVVEQVGDDLADAGLEPFDAPQRERRRDQASQPGVIGRIDREHVPGERPPR